MSLKFEELDESQADQAVGLVSRLAEACLARGVADLEFEHSDMGVKIKMTIPSAVIPPSDESKPARDECTHPTVYYGRCHACGEVMGDERED